MIHTYIHIYARIIFICMRFYFLWLIIAIMYEVIYMWFQYNVNILYVDARISAIVCINNHVNCTYVYYKTYIQVYSPVRLVSNPSDPDCILFRVWTQSPALFYCWISGLKPDYHRTEMLTRLMVSCSYVHRTTNIAWRFARTVINAIIYIMNRIPKLYGYDA